MACIVLLVPAAALAESSSVSANSSTIQLQQHLITTLEKLIQVMATEITELQSELGAGSTALVETPTAASRSISATATSDQPASSNCQTGYHQEYVGEIVSAPYYCITSTNPVTVVPLPAGSVWPMGSCYNGATNPTLSLLGQSTDYFDHPLPSECVPDSQPS
jgi:hypothetical protein